MSIFHHSELASLHPYLYKRVRLKGIIFSIYGLMLIFGKWLPFILLGEAGKTAGPSAFAGYITLGIIWLIFGMAILWGLYTGPRNYLKSRIILRVAFFWVFFWYMGILTAVILGHPRPPAVLLLFGYLTYNIRMVINDSGWAGAELVKEIRENIHGKSPA